MRATLAGGDWHKSITISNPSMPKRKHSDPYGVPARRPTTPEQQCRSFMGSRKKESEESARKGFSAQTDETIQPQGQAWDLGVTSVWTKLSFACQMENRTLSTYVDLGTHSSPQL